MHFPGKVCYMSLGHCLAYLVVYGHVFVHVTRKCIINYPDVHRITTLHMCVIYFVVV